MRAHGACAFISLYWVLGNYQVPNKLSPSCSKNYGSKDRSPASR